ncbi:MAG: damage-control phosphatase ARMT1 family protein [Candidatus Njordarchaeales archaeon]
MKVAVDCLECLFHRALVLTRDMLKLSPEATVEACKKVLRLLLKEFNLNQVPAWLGTKREKILQRVLKDPDPYKKFKEETTMLVMRLWKEVRDRFLEGDGFDTFRRLLLAAAAANSIDPFILGYDLNLDNFLEQVASAEKNLRMDQSRDLWKDLSTANNVLYILDNAGEAVIDLDVVRFIKEKLGKKVIVAAREKPVLNDITVEEAKKLGFGEIADKVVPVGWFIGVFFNEFVNTEFLKTFDAADLVIAKGMAAYESMTEYTFEKPVYIILKAKCNPVASHIGVPRGSYVIKRI